MIRGIGRGVSLLAVDGDLSPEVLLHLPGNPSHQTTSVLGPQLGRLAESSLEDPPVYCPALAFGAGIGLLSPAAWKQMVFVVSWILTVVIHY